MLHQHFKTPNVGGAIRSYYLATALAQKGHQVAVISAHNGKSISVKKIEGIDIIYLPIPYDNRFSFSARSLAFVRYVCRTIQVASKYKDYDVCYAISVPLTVGIIARWLKFWYRIPYVFEVGDLWPDAPIQMGFIRSRLFQRILYALEKTIYYHADSIVALSESIRLEIEKKIKGKRIDVIPNMADCDFYFQEEKTPALEMKYQLTGKLVVSYMGALGVANGLEYLLDCAEACLQKELPVHFMICGDGAMAEELNRSAKQRQLNNITFAGFMNQVGIREVMNVTDAVFVCYKKVPILETGSPNKYFDGLASGKMVIINFGGWIRSEIEMNGCGLYVDPNDPGNLAVKIYPFTADRELLKGFQAAARVLGEKKYSRSQLGESFSRIFSANLRQKTHIR